MLSEDLTRTALQLPFEDRMELARRLVESVVSPSPVHQAVVEGMRRIEEMASGRVAPLTEDEFRAALR